MHEYSLVDALVRRVEAEARARRAIAVHGLTVGLGELAGVDPQLFRTAYETFRAGTVCEDATLTVVEHPASWRCDGCGRGFAKGDVLRCGRCGRPARMEEESDALLLESIDMEIP